MPYQPRQPREALLYRIVSGSLAPFLAQMEGRLPRHGEREFEAFLDCGVFEQGVAAFVCDGCGRRAFVPFSCKRRGFCPSCLGRRMNEGAEHLCERVLPDVPVRQWVLSLPMLLRFLLLRRPEGVGGVLAVFLRAVFGYHCRRAKRLGVREPRTGSVTITQRFGSALQANLHFHALVLDGVYHAPQEGAGLVFVRLPVPTQEELAEVVEKVRVRVLRHLRRRGLLEGDGLAEEVAESDDEVLGRLQGASLLGRVTAGPKVGWRVVGVRGMPVACARHRELCVEAQGFNLHAGVHVIARRRGRLLSLCRYVLRPPLSNDRLELREDGRVLLKLKRAWEDGTAALLLEPEDLLGRLAAIVPPRRRHTIHYHGVLAPHAGDRGAVVPELEVANEGQTAEGQTAAPPRGVRKERRPRRERMKWAELLQRTFAVDVLACVCGGRMRFLCWITDPTALRRIEQSLQRGRPPPPTV